ncbi:MAG TPA: cupredoxin family copper-binding protein [Candidatus Acidoferrum sp.]|nr:cupredoxin family copper-binding protein [Candidatus Acidoferrum sp.]
MKGNRKWNGIVFGCALVFGLTIAVRSSADEATQKAAGSTSQVKIDNFTFAPGAVTVPAGTTVQWVNRDDIPHTVVSEDKSTFKSKALDTDDNYSYMFTKPGTYTYFCSIHPKMTGKVVVQ